MRTNSSFRLSKSTKRALATMIDPQKRAAWKRCMIDAESTAAVQPRTSKNKK